MGSARLFQLLVISVFSAAIALIGLNELSNRFIQAGKREGVATPIPRDLVKELRGESQMLKPLPNQPTPEGEPAPEGAAKAPGAGEAAYGAVSSGWRKMVDKLLPKG